MKIKATDYNTNEIIKIIREWTGLTQQEFAKPLFRTERSIRAYECAERQVTFETILQIAKVYKINIIISKENK